MEPGGADRDGAVSSAAVPKPFSTSTWFSGVGAGLTDSGVLV